MPFQLREEEELVSEEQREILQTKEGNGTCKSPEVEGT